MCVIGVNRLNTEWSCYEKHFSNLSTEDED